MKKRLVSLKMSSVRTCNELTEIWQLNILRHHGGLYWAILASRDSAFSAMAFFSDFSIAINVKVLRLLFSLTITDLSYEKQTWRGVRQDDIVSGYLPPAGKIGDFAKKGLTDQSNHEIIGKRGRKLASEKSGVKLPQTQAHSGFEAFGTQNRSRASGHAGFSDSVYFIIR